MRLGARSYKNTFTSFLKQERLSRSPEWRAKVGASDEDYDVTGPAADGAGGEGQGERNMRGMRQTEMEKVPVRDFLHGFNQSVKTNVDAPPNYLFSTAFVSENPSLMATAAPVFDWVRTGRLQGVDTRSN